MSFSVTRCPLGCSIPFWGTKYNTESAFQFAKPTVPYFTMEFFLRWYWKLALTFGVFEQISYILSYSSL